MKYMHQGKTAEIMGLSTESKPADVPTGSVFFEVDTFEMYVFYEGVWYKKEG